MPSKQWSTIFRERDGEAPFSSTGHGSFAGRYQKPLGGRHRLKTTSCKDVSCGAESDVLHVLHSSIPNQHR